MEIERKRNVLGKEEGGEEREARVWKEENKWIRNFIWFGDVSMKKLVTVYWEKVCHHAKEEGYGDQIA